MAAIKPMLLGINGVKKSGKNTAAEILEEWCGDKFTARSQGLADALKISAARAIGLIEETPEQCIEAMDTLKFCGDVTTNIEHGEHDVQEIIINGREFLQFYGTEAHREIFDPDFWINHLLPLDKPHLYAKWDQEDGGITQLMMVTDVRFPNEAQRIRDLDGFVLRIRRPGVEDGQDAHASEQPLPNELVDEVIVNDQGVAEFEERVRHFAQRRLLAGLSSGLGRWD